MAIDQEIRGAGELRQGLEGLQLSQTGLASLMTELGDRRELKTVLRSIQRMAGGEARLSGEMQVILTLLQRDQARARRLLAATTWTQGENGRQWAEIQGVRVSVAPQTRGRWSISARHVADGPDGYSPPFPHWRDSESEAKLRAVMAVDETLDHLEQIEEEGRRDAAAAAT